MKRLHLNFYLVWLMMVMIQAKNYIRDWYKPWSVLATGQLKVSCEDWKPEVDKISLSFFLLGMLDLVKAQP